MGFPTEFSTTGKTSRRARKAGGQELLLKDGLVWVRKQRAELMPQSVWHCITRVSSTLVSALQEKIFAQAGFF
jgi:hypothetical protein